MESTSEKESACLGNNLGSTSLPAEGALEQTRESLAKREVVSRCLTPIKAIKQRQSESLAWNNGGTLLRTSHSASNLLSKGMPRAAS
jgi:hypothetical protein